MHGRLNIFQKTMLQWNEMHSYNAVHVVKMPGRLEAARLKDAINNHISRCGLTHLSIDREENTFRYSGGFFDHEVRAIVAQGEAYDALQEAIEHHLNAPFDASGTFSPFRFFVVDAGGSFYLGLVYFHCVSGAESIVLLLKDIVHIYRGQGASALSFPLELYPPGYGRLVKTDMRMALGWCRTFPSLVSALRSSCRPRFRNLEDGHIGFRLLTLSPSRFRHVVSTSKRWGVTVNDMFLALLLKALLPLASARANATRRNRVSVASIVNIRKDLGIDSAKTFGLFLASFFVSHAVREDISLEALARDVNLQTGTVKKHRLYLRSILEMALSGLLFPRLSPSRRKKFYPKYHPMWGGITNMNMNTLWWQEKTGESIDYYRAVCTGPVVPLVLSITTVRDSVNIGVSYRTTVYSDDDIKGIIRRFTGYIEDPGATA